MSSKRGERRRACTGKIRHESQAAAIQHYRAVSRSDALSNSGRGWMHAYRCKFCGGWHVGHMPDRIRQSILDRRAAAHGHDRAGDRARKRSA